MTDTILYLVFGNKREFQLELTYSVLSTAHFLRSQEIRIALACNPANRRPDLPVEHLVVSDAELNSWITQYKYAAKAYALGLGLERYGGSVALLDTDTVFTSNPRDLFRRVGPGRSLMQAEDGVLGDHACWRDLLDQLDGPVEGCDVSSKSRMMNSGVVALHESDKAAVPAALGLMSALHAIEPIFNIEQFAFTAALEQRGELAACDDVIWHYWGHQRRFAHAQLGALFPEFDKDTFIRHLDAPPPIGMPPTLARARARLLQLVRRCDGDYRFAYIASLCAVGERNNEWAHVTLDVLEAMEHLPAKVTTDFGRFRGERLDAHAWLSSAARQRWQAFWSAYGQGRSAMHAEIGS
ncbi:hypothetical protein SAMN04489859_102713 [Paracoccus alcaliphilus]|uniref:Glycosyl transferase family 8 n=1 Tax=Paracoccus alcaliphilus TaxID=34002 RepID=A0A1H8L2L2_9RHOB|nr:hypothetical protein [Paracoccus alcaliphilus]WCR18098.1 hypothetical protein JHW40_17720 [Paracoccus alcaliphilus]SEN99384.1 hypothetical protein SAMN04489859_102713 [Paracoccus alcaliphilus]